MAFLEQLATPGLQAGPQQVLAVWEAALQVLAANSPSLRGQLQSPKPYFAACILRRCVPYVRVHIRTQHATDPPITYTHTHTHIHIQERPPAVAATPGPDPRAACPGDVGRPGILRPTRAAGGRRRGMRGGGPRSAPNGGGGGGAGRGRGRVVVPGGGPRGGAGALDAGAAVASAAGAGSADVSFFFGVCVCDWDLNRLTYTHAHMKRHAQHRRLPPPAGAARAGGAGGGGQGGLRGPARRLGATRCAPYVTPVSRHTV